MTLFQAGIGAVTLYFLSTTTEKVRTVEDLAYFVPSIVSGAVALAAILVTGCRDLTSKVSELEERVASVEATVKSMETTVNTMQATLTTLARRVRAG